MTRLLAPCRAIALALPLVLPLALALPATAAPVLVTSTTSGTADPYPLVLSHLGWDHYDDYTGPALPYTLTISALVDPEGPQFYAWDNQLSQYNTDITISFRLGDDLFEYSGKGRAGIVGGASSYALDLPFGTMSYQVNFTNRLEAPSGVFGDALLAPRTLAASDGLSGSAHIEAWPLNPDAPGYWSMRTDGSAASLSISPVPEPASVTMFAAGLLLFGATLSRGRRKPFLEATLVVQQGALPRRATCSSTPSSCSTPSRPPTPIS